MLSADSRNASGLLAEIKTLHTASPFDRLAIAESEWTALRSGSGRQACVELINFCESHDVAVYILPAFTGIAVRQREIASFDGMPLIRVRDAARHPLYGLFKDATDRLLALAVLVLGAPLWLLIAALIKLTSPGPVLFSQMRAGMRGVPFRIFKFRTMTVDAEERLRSLIDVDALATPGFKIRNDPRVTRFGRFLRRTALDEIPQLVNVLRGEMSLVGPRPEMIELVERYTPEQRRRLKAKPGITGYQQVVARGIPLSEGVHLDLFYLKRQGPLLDAYILLRTVFVVLTGKGVSS
jgi:lipopolysaccharide/colanic/teichoic acid biosynthesis glycosyltransferase